MKKSVLPYTGVFARFLILFLLVLFLSGFYMPVHAESSEEEQVNMPETDISLPEEEHLIAGQSANQNVSLLLADNAEDPNYILVEKTFSGIPDDLLPDEFRVTVTSDAGSIYTLNKENTTNQTADAEGNIIWCWKIIGVGTGKYTVSEEGENIANYTVTKFGEGTVNVKAADMTVLVPVHETTCSHKNWPVKVEGDNNVLFAATLTQGGVAVISQSPLSASQRASVTQAVLKINGPWKNPVYFYSIEEQMKNGSGFELNGATITYNSATEEIIIGQTRNWQHVATLQYSISDAGNPEIALRNVYTSSTANVTIQKMVEGNIADSNKSFAFTVSVTKDGDDVPFSIDGVEYRGSAVFTLKHGQSVLIKDIPVGAQLSVTESDYTDDRYYASYTVDQAETFMGNTATVRNVTDNGHFILFMNRKDAVPDTGVRLDILPNLMILGIVVLCSAVLLIRGRNKQNNEG